MAEIEAGAERCLMATVEGIYDEASITHMRIENEEDEYEIDPLKAFEMFVDMGYEVEC